MFPDKPSSSATHPCASSDSPPAADGNAILELARNLSSRQGMASPSLPLKGRNVALVCEDGDVSSNIFCHSAHQLGARVSQIRPSLTEDSDPKEIHDTARLLGQLYAALEWPHLSPKLLAQLRKEMTIPIYTGISLRSHPLAPWAAQLDVNVPAEDKWRLIIQAVLLRDLA